MTKNEFIAALVAPRRRSRSATLWREWIGVTLRQLFSHTSCRHRARVRADQADCPDPPLDQSRSAVPKVSRRRWPILAESVG